MGSIIQLILFKKLHIQYSKKNLDVQYTYTSREERS